MEWRETQSLVIPGWCLIMIINNAGRRGCGVVGGGQAFTRLHCYTGWHTHYTHITHSYTHYPDWGEGRLETEFPSPEYDLSRWCGEAGDQRGGGAIAAWVGPLLFWYTSGFIFLLPISQFPFSDNVIKEQNGSNIFARPSIFWFKNR